ncbi:MAG: hypothetical protein AMXMBFR79_02340 [Chitinophagaceae bacterium]|nr:1-acyl-sn-glycerol-3-phosphate acyltransferase [Chitinophagales bacterium]
MKQVVSFLQNIFARVWALWGLVTFIITFIIILIPSLFTSFIKDEKKSQAAFIYLSKVWMNIWLTLIACPIKVSGKENVDKNETYIFTCNHNSLLDAPITCPYIPGANKTIAKTSFAKIPIFGWYYKKGSILVDRKSDASRRKSFDNMKKTLQQFIHVVIFPEGTRNRTSNPLKNFYDGAFKLSITTQTSIVPTLLFNSAKAMPHHKIFYLLPHQLEIRYLPPVSPKGLDVTALKEKVFAIMQDEFVKG